jgi:hypothetical protein
MRRPNAGLSVGIIGLSGMCSQVHNSRIVKDKITACCVAIHCGLRRVDAASAHEASAVTAKVAATLTDRAKV